MTSRYILYSKLGKHYNIYLYHFNADRCYLGQTRLVGGQNDEEGRVEVCSDSYSRWGTVCDKQWSPRHTSIVCRQLGYSENDGKL